MTLYVSVLFVHSSLRWFVLALALSVTARSALGLWRQLPWSATHERLHKALLLTADLQLALGLALYLWLSPFSRAFFHNPRVGFHDASLRFFGIEHVFGMSIALTLLHFGQVRAQRARTAWDKQRQACWFSLAALLLMAASVPWPFMPYPRPLWRGL
jgi:hypothetical protein